MSSGFFITDPILPLYCLPRFYHIRPGL